MEGAHTTPSLIPDSTLATAVNTPRSLWIATRIPGATPRRSASAGCSKHSGSRAARLNAPMFTNVELRNWCAGDEMSVRGKRFIRAGSRSGDSYGGMYVGTGSNPISFSRSE